MFVTCLVRRLIDLPLIARPRSRFQAIGRNRPLVILVSRRYPCTPASTPNARFVKCDHRAHAEIPLKPREEWPCLGKEKGSFPPPRGIRSSHQSDPKYFLVYGNFFILLFPFQYWQSTALAIHSSMEPRSSQNRGENCNLRKHSQRIRCGQRMDWDISHSRSIQDGWRLSLVNLYPAIRVAITPYMKWACSRLPAVVFADEMRSKVEGILRRQLS
ncbi:hypothetical protein CIHG_02627 [Coccidioides immitis H538.4]|uniref:Uncharacterized protein n=2 Tax=Coccidioides immitis TaxID=5501 RepID=A0A0J8UC98_COCIT|nr:hypothetical protein CIRG_02954 [Coccidioides immitis RMSCC 2394]KMU84843.1 hypothetical protein CIHG_02627 [Coccidioides immitis H538.4]